MTPEQREAGHRTALSIAPPLLHDQPTAYLNPGGGSGPFAVVELGAQAWLYIHDAAHARAIAAAFTKAAGLLDDHTAHAAQSPEQPPPDAGDSDPGGAA